MCELKFRMRQADGGEFYFSLEEIIEQHNATAAATEIIRVVDQLVGYDSDGEEVYEGDVLIFDDEDYGHYEYEARLNGCATTEDGCYIPAEKFKERRLKI